MLFVVSLEMVGVLSGRIINVLLHCIYCVELGVSKVPVTLYLGNICENGKKTAEERC